MSMNIKYHWNWLYHKIHERIQNTQMNGYDWDIFIAKQKFNSKLRCIDLELEF